MGIDLSGGGNGLRSPAAQVLLGAALSISLVLGGSFLAIDRLHSTTDEILDHPAHPSTDDQSKAEVVQQAKHLVAIAGLRQATAGYLLMSCKDRESPPYQGAVYLNFTVPGDARADTYFDKIATAMVARGWQEGLASNRYLFGKTLHQDGVTAILYRDDDDPNLGIARLYGQCRNMTDHRNDTTAWVDVTDQIQ